jgi:hypothetical protein
LLSTVQVTTLQTAVHRIQYSFIGICSAQKTKYYDNLTLAKTIHNDLSDDILNENELVLLVRNIFVSVILFADSGDDETDFVL